MFSKIPFKCFLLLFVFCFFFTFLGCGGSAATSSTVDWSSNPSNNEKTPFEGVKVTCMTYEDSHISSLSQQTVSAAE